MKITLKYTNHLSMEKKTSPEILCCVVDAYASENNLAYNNIHVHMCIEIWIEIGTDFNLNAGASNQIVHSWVKT